MEMHTGTYSLRRYTAQHDTTPHHTTKRQVADECLNLKNFNGLLQVMGSMSKTEIHRLKNTWELVPKVGTLMHRQTHTLRACRHTHEQIIH